MVEAMATREILKEYLRMVKPPANMPVDKWITVRGPTKWYRPVMMKT